MENPDLSNLLGQETVKKIYEDGASESIKEASKIGVDLVKALRLFTAPIQLAAAYQDRFVKYLDEIRDSVPVDKQIDCSPSIGGPILERLKYIEEDNYLKNLYLNLLKKAIDRDNINQAHPAFVTIIEQLSPDEALILKIISESWPKITMEVLIETTIEVGAISCEEIIVNNFPLEELVFQQNFEMYMKHLNFLNLVEMTQGQFNDGKVVPPNMTKVFRVCYLSSFGQLFYNACIK